MKLMYPPDYVVAPVVLTCFVFYILRVVHQELQLVQHPHEQIQVDGLVFTGMFMVVAAVYIGYYHSFTGISLCICLCKELWVQGQV